MQVTQIFEPRFHFYFERLGEKYMQAYLFIFVNQFRGSKSEVKIGNVRSERQKFLNQYEH